MIVRDDFGIREDVFRYGSDVAFETLQRPGPINIGLVQPDVFAVDRYEPGLGHGAFGGESIYRPPLFG